MINLNRPTADDAMLHAHSRAVAAPKRQPKPAVRHPVHAMCLAMSEVYERTRPISRTANSEHLTWTRLRRALPVAPAYILVTLHGAPL